MIPVVELDDNHKPTIPWESERWGVCGCHNVRGYDGPPVNQSDENEDAS